MVHRDRGAGAGPVTRYPGDYDDFLVEREARQAQLEAQARNQAKRIARSSVSSSASATRRPRRGRSRAGSRRSTRWSGSRQAGARRIRFAFPQPPAPAGWWPARRVHKSYGENEVYAGIDFLLERGDRVALVGVNGAGKSTLLKMLAGALPIDAGERVLGNTWRCSTTRSTSSTRWIRRGPCSRRSSWPTRGADPRLRTILGAFLFSGDTSRSGSPCCPAARRPARARQDACSARRAPVPGRADQPPRPRVQGGPGRGARGFTGTIVFISHDRYFINRIATQVVEVDRGRLTTHLGTYDDYLDHKAQAAATPDGPTAPRPRGRPRRNPNPRIKRTSAAPRASAAEGRRGPHERPRPRGVRGPHECPRAGGVPGPFRGPRR